MNEIREFLTHYPGPLRYVVFFLLIMGCGMGLPFNSDLCLITASVLAALGVFNFKFLIPIAFIALLSGDSVAFFVGRHFGRRVLTIAPFKWIISESKINAAENYLNTKGVKFLFFVRFFPLIRTALFLAAGCLRVPPRQFYLMNGSSTLIYLPSLMITSYLASEHIDEVIAFLKRFQYGLLGLVVLTVAAVVIKTKMKRARPV